MGLDALRWFIFGSRLPNKVNHFTPGIPNKNIGIFRWNLEWRRLTPNQRVFDSSQPSRGNQPEIRSKVALTPNLLVMHRIPPETPRNNVLLVILRPLPSAATVIINVVIVPRRPRRLPVRIQPWIVRAPIPVRVPVGHRRFRRTLPVTTDRKDGPRRYQAGGVPICVAVFAGT